MKIRVKFKKSGYIKYVGHLDTMRMFQRAVKVAQIPIAYSNGFNPHALIYFAMPLAVGVTSEGEYMELVLEKPMTPSEVRKRLEAVMVPDITLVDVYEIEEKTESLMSIVSAADYSLLFKVLDTPTLCAQQVAEYIDASETLEVMKKSKKGMITVDIKPLILSYEVFDEKPWIAMKLRVYAGSSKNLNPELLVKAIVKEQPYEFQLVRTELYAGEEDSLIPLDQVGRLNL